MSGWDALAAGAGYLGNAIQQKQAQDRADRKAALLAQLQQEKEQRAYDRELRKVKDSKIESDNEGVYWKVDRNAEGTVLNKELAPKSDIDRINTTNQKDKLTLEELLASTQLKNKQAASYDESQQLKNENIQSQIERNRKTGDAALIRANKPSGSSKSEDDEQEVGLGEATNDLVKDYGTLVRSYTGKNGVLTEEEVYQLASDSIKAAAAKNKDVGDTFAKALAIHAAKAKKQSATTPKSGGALTLGK